MNVWEPYKVWMIPCKCRSLEHLIILNYDKDYKEWSMSYQLVQYQSFWKRLVMVFRYLFHLKGQSFWDETLVCTEDRAKIREWLDAE